MLRLRMLRALTLQAGAASWRPGFLSAASGLVCIGDQLYVVADDELHLGVFDVRGRRAGRLLRLFSGELSSKLKKRKKQKPDLEVLMQLPAMQRHQHGALLALGSGSKERRHRGALIALDEKGGVARPPVEADAEPLFQYLQTKIDALDVEGAWIHGSNLNLLQRESKGERGGVAAGVGKCSRDQTGRY